MQGAGFRLARTIAAMLCFAGISAVHAAVWQVTPDGKLRLAEAARLARDGDTVELAAGDYHRAVAVWLQNRLTIRGVPGKTRIFADGAAAENKAIFVIRARGVVVQGIEFRGARVPDRNGAGIRLERGSLSVADCRFIDNENGILTANEPSITLDVERSEFGSNGAGDGQSHNLYAGAIERLSVQASYFHHARVGHLLKSRARRNLVQYNRLSDEIGGRASYELEFPNGGYALVVGNLIEQASSTENSKIISVGAEGYRWPENAVYLAYNTIVNDRPEGGAMLDVRPGTVKVVAANNLLSGRSAGIRPGVPAEIVNNPEVDFDVFVNALREDYRLKRASAVFGKAVPFELPGVALEPASEYVHPLRIRALGTGARSPGAFQTPGD